MDWHGPFEIGGGADVCDRRVDAAVKHRDDFDVRGLDAINDGVPESVEDGAPAIAMKHLTALGKVPNMLQRRMNLMDEGLAVAGTCVVRATDGEYLLEKSPCGLRLPYKAVAIGFSR